MRKAERIALQKRDDKTDIVNPGMVTAFGGTAEEGESIEDALNREFLEEMGVAIDGFRITSLGVMDKKERDGTVTTCHFYCVDDIEDKVGKVFEGNLIIYPDLSSALGAENMSVACRWALGRMGEDVKTLGT